MPQTPHTHQSSLQLSTLPLCELSATRALGRATVGQIERFSHLNELGAKLAY